MTPTVGSFFVRPFEFLSVLDAVYNSDEFEEIRDEIPARLKAAEGDVQGTQPLIDREEQE